MDPPAYNDIASSAIPTAEARPPSAASAVPRRAASAAAVVVVVAVVVSSSSPRGHPAPSRTPRARPFKEERHAHDSAHRAPHLGVVRARAPLRGDERRRRRHRSVLGERGAAMIPPRPFTLVSRDDSSPPLHSRLSRVIAPPPRRAEVAPGVTAKVIAGTCGPLVAPVTPLVPIQCVANVARATAVAVCERAARPSTAARLSLWSRGTRRCRR